MYPSILYTGWSKSYQTVIHANSFRWEEDRALRFPPLERDDKGPSNHQLQIFFWHVLWKFSIERLENQRTAWIRQSEFLNIRSTLKPPVEYLQYYPESICFALDTQKLQGFLRKILSKCQKIWFWGLLHFRENPHWRSQVLLWFSTICMNDCLVTFGPTCISIFYVKKS